MNTRLAFLCALWIGSVAWSGIQGQHNFDAPLLGFAFLLALLCDFTAVRLPGAGYVSQSFAVTMFVAIYPRLGATASVLICSVSHLLRAFVLPTHTQLSVVLIAAFVELVPQTVAVGISTMFKGIAGQTLAGCVAYLGLCLVVPELLASQLPKPLASRLMVVDSRLFSIRLICCALVVFYAMELPQPHAGGILFALSVLAFCGYVARLVVELDQQRETHDVTKMLGKSQARLQNVSKQREELENQVIVQQREMHLLEIAASSFLRSESREHVAQSLVQLCSQLSNCSSIGVFVRQDGRVIPISLKSPHRDRIDEAQIAGLREVMVERCLQSMTEQLQPVGLPSQRIFSDEPVAMALPLADQGALYLGKKSGQFDELELRYLKQAVSLGGLGLRISSQIGELRLGLRSQEALTEQLNRRSNMLDNLLRQSLNFMGTLTPQQLQATLERVLLTLYPGVSVEVCLDGSHPLEACRAVLESHSPLVLEDLSETRFEPHLAGQRSLMCVPIVHQSLSKIGLLILGAGPASAFGRHDRDLVLMLSYLAAVAWKNAELHAETIAAQAQLIQSSKMSAVGQLADGVAHELNTPLGSIALNLDFVKQMMPAGSDKIIARIDKASEMLTRSRGIVDKLLYYARESNSGRKLTLIRVLVRDTVELVSHTLARDQVTIALNLDESAQTALNQNEMQQVLMNLLFNARDAVKELPPERRKLVIECLAPENAQLTIKVIDLGPGIPAEHAERVFEPFYTTKPVGSGTGLGLSVSQQVVKAHGGTIHFVSREGEGCEFVIRLPVVAEASESPSSYAQ